MAIYKKDKEISALYYGRRVITAVYYGTKVVWEAVTSCFGKGYWINPLKWSNTEGWKNN